MGPYSKFVLPYPTDFAMRDKAARTRRSQLVPGADGVVLEIGIGLKARAVASGDAA